MLSLIYFKCLVLVSLSHAGVPIVDPIPLSAMPQFHLSKEIDEVSNILWDLPGYEKVVV